MADHLRLHSATSFLSVEWCRISPLSLIQHLSPSSWNKSKHVLRKAIRQHCKSSTMSCSLKTWCTEESSQTACFMICKHVAVGRDPEALTSESPRICAILSRQYP